MTTLAWGAFAAASAAGAVLRFVVDTALAKRATGAFPRGTFAVNLLGSFVLGALVAAAPRGSVLLFVVGTGFCGSFTTFSTFCYETVVLLQEGQPAIALRSLAMTAFGCVAAAAAGHVALA